MFYGLDVYFGIKILFFQADSIRFLPTGGYHTVSTHRRIFSRATSGRMASARGIPSGVRLSTLLNPAFSRDSASLAFPATSQTGT